jgi:ApbE superfamily uncharacterized protein (UPF0280 family)
MRERASMQKLTGDRLHFQHGPIDVVLKAWGEPDEVRKAIRAATKRFPFILPELTDELVQLRKTLDRNPRLSAPVGMRMLEAVRPFADVFVTPMAAVAGSVAEELMTVMRAAGALDKAYVNDGGDIAVHLEPGQSLTFGIAGDFSAGPIPGINGTLTLTHELGIGGIATSGAQGRSFSRGIADSVTVLAATASTADVAATLIANAVDVDAKSIERMPARELDPDSDLGDLLVTTEVGKLTKKQVAAALDAGAAQAEVYRSRGLIAGAVLMLRGESRVVGGPAVLLAGSPPSTAAPSKARK